MFKTRNEFLDHDLSDESDHEAGYDSEAAEKSKTSRQGVRNNEGERSTKRRKLSHSPSDSEASEDDFDQSFVTARDHISPVKRLPPTKNQAFPLANVDVADRAAQQHSDALDHTPPPAQGPSKKKNKKDLTPGVIYLSSLPPYLKPSALRNLLSQRGLEPITRLFLTPSSKHKARSSKNSRQLYSEGWIEFGSKKTARRCAETLNAQIVGGNKRGFYHDDIWNMKYLKGMRWDELMAGIREERREEEGRRDEERRKVAAETKRFVEGVEEGKRIEGMQRKRKAKRSRDGALGTTGDDEQVKRTWSQFEVKGQTQQESVSGSSANTKGQGKEHISDDVKQVLSKIF